MGILIALGAGLLVGIVGTVMILNGMVMRRLDLLDKLIRANRRLNVHLRDVTPPEPTPPGEE